MTNSRIRSKTPYWVFLKPLFHRYNITLKGKPYEPQVKKVVKGWLTEHDIELVQRQGQGINIVDFEFSWQGYHIGIETKGHSNHPHNLTKIIDQIKRYLTHLDFLIVITHSFALKSQIKRALTYTPSEIAKRILLLKIRDIDHLIFDLNKKIEQFEEEKRR